MAGEHILVVEDDGILAAHLQDTLTGLGYVVRAAVATGEDAVTVVENGTVDLVLMDIELAGELNGIAAAEQIRANSDVPIVFLTGYSQEPLVQKAKVTAPAGYLIKPVPVRELQATIETALYRQILDRELKESRDRFRTLVENIPGAVYRCDPVFPWSISFLSDAVYSLTGRPARVFTREGIPWGELIRKEDRAEVVEKIEQGIASGIPFSLEYRIIHADAGLRWVQQTGKAMFDRSGKAVQLDGVMLEITERKQLEQQRLELQREFLNARKFESLVTLAGGVAHDFNNILTGVYGNMEMALRKLPPDAAARGFVESALESSERALALANQMLAFTGQGHGRLEIVDLNEIVAGSLAGILATVSRTVSVRSEFHPSPLPVRADPEQLHRVALNLMVNAMEAAGAAPCTVTVATGVTECDAPSLAASRIAEKPPEGFYACLDVCDTGCGMDGESLSRIFDPFFSTKFLGRGLGMPAVYGIVKGHGGALLLESEPGKGTNVRVLLPYAG